jgi:hypothetical protein
MLKWLEKFRPDSPATIAARQNLYFYDFEDRDSDIYIITYYRSGTTWMQVILYNLLTNGNMDFEHIYDVSPWVKNESTKTSSPKRVNNLPSPRIIKTHDRYDFFNPESRAKFIYVYRDGKDVAVSLYYQNKHYNDPDLTFDKNFSQYYIEDDELNWFQFTSEWLQNKNNFNILYLSYEQLKNDFDRALRKIAAFLDVELTDDVKQRVKAHASFEYMKANESKFGEIPTENEKLVYNQFIRSGKTGEGKTYLKEEQTKLFDEQYVKYVAPWINKLH